MLWSSDLYGPRLGGVEVGSSGVDIQQMRGGVQADPLAVLAQKLSVVYDIKVGLPHQNLKLNKKGNYVILSRLSICKFPSVNISFGLK